MAADFTGHYGLHWYSPQACGGQLPTSGTSDLEPFQAFNGLHNPPGMYQWQAAADEHQNSTFTGFDFRIPEWNVQSMQRNDLQSVAFEKDYVNTTVSDRLIEDGAVQNPVALQAQLSTVPLVNQDVEHVYQLERPISPLPPSERFPPVPFQDVRYTSLEPFDQLMNYIPPFREHILPTNFQVLPDTGSVATFCDNLFGPGDRAKDNPSFATSSLPNYEALRYSNTRAVVEPFQHQHISVPLSPPFMNPLDLDFHNHGEDIASDDDPFRPYMPPLSQPRGRPRGRPRTRNAIPTPPTSTSRHRHGHKRRCEWDENCGAYVSASSVVSHIKLHVALELVEAMFGVTGTKFNVRYMLKPSTMAEFQFEDLAPKERAIVVMDHGKVWAKCMWGTDGCYFCREHLPLNYLPRHVMSMHLGLGNVGMLA
ncbi:hypothetical protein M378DRAFT_397873 [Amanita muscaria Koide BX008]|uniref:Uncharacterized protein n=1 Tax=Amanita muscaria (strain Koide BX008) TaxID=946122 RepID=A0A0C2W7Z4_AMAMK|nr:hypothetical protein M378DRAFT_397873 [Amanita muscaria Koide BX008]